MKKNILLILLSVFFCVAVSSAALQKTGVFILAMSPDARSMSLGGTGGACAGGIYSAFWNPAGLVDIERFAAASSYGFWFAKTGLLNISLGYQPQNIGAFGVAFTLLSTGSFPATADNIGETDEMRNAGSSLLTASFARRVLSSWAAGVNLKIASEDLDGDRKSAFAGDLGVIFEGIKSVRLGLTVVNIGAGPEFGTGRDDLPFNIRVGALKNFDFGRKGLNLACDVDIPLYAPVSVHGGGEFVWRGLPAGIDAFLRVGGKYPAEAGNNFWSNLTFGAGLSFMKITLDWAFSSYDELGNLNKLSINYLF